MSDKLCIMKGMVGQLPQFSLEPVNAVVVKDQVFNVKLNISSGGVPVISSDAWVLYDPKQVEPLPSIKNGGVFPSVQAKIVEPGRLYVFGLRYASAKPSPAEGMIVDIPFKAIGSGKTILEFECVPGVKLSSQIVKHDASLVNIIDCTSTKIHTTLVDIQSQTQVLGTTDSRAIFNPWNLVGLVALMVMTVIVLRSFLKVQNAENEL